MVNLLLSKNFGAFRATLGSAAPRGEGGGPGARPPPPPPGKSSQMSSPALSGQLQRISGMCSLSLPILIVTDMLQTFLIMTSFAEKHCGSRVSLHDLSQIHYSFPSCSPLLCQYVVRLVSIFAIWENSSSTKLADFSAFPRMTSLLQGL